VPKPSYNALLSTYRGETPPKAPENLHRLLRGISRKDALVDVGVGPPPGTTAMLDLAGKIVLITGLGQSSPDGWGIGAAIAVLFARQGAKVFGGNRSITSTEVTQKRIKNEGGICDVLATDVTSSASVKALVDGCMAKYGRIDILVNNVGKSEPGDPASMSEKIWDSQMDINLKSVYLTCHYVLPIMEEQGSGSVVSVASIAGLRFIGKPQAAYSATKAALLHLMKTTAVIYADRGVRLNTVVPGLMYTPYTELLADRYGAGDKEAYMKIRHQQVPMGRMGDAWDVANAALFLVSDEARYITGQEIVVDGGISSSTGRP
jgi:NAD(P)-dependent dehydrogenase (short-subunit alcohol dehydrogenase family)